MENKEKNSDNVIQLWEYVNEDISEDVLNNDFKLFKKK